MYSHEQRMKAVELILSLTRVLMQSSGILGILLTICLSYGIGNILKKETCTRSPENNQDIQQKKKQLLSNTIRSMGEASTVRSRLSDIIG